jgi:hypothetical protein
MKEFYYDLKLRVKIPAFDEDDAWEAIQDTFGVGETNGIEVLECEWDSV